MPTRPLHALAAVFLALLASGCYMNMAQRWADFDRRLQAEVGQRSAQSYYDEWGRPAKERKLPDGSWEMRWEMRGYGGGQGWDKTLVFAPDGKLKSYSYDYWPKD